MFMSLYVFLKTRRNILSDLSQYDPIESFFGQNSRDSDVVFFLQIVNDVFETVDVHQSRVDFVVNQWRI